MIQTVFKGKTVFLLNDQPDWSTSPETQFALTRDSQMSLTRRETRRAYSFTLLTKSFTFSAVVTRTDLLALQGALRTITTESVIVPFWPAIEYWRNRNTTKINGGLRIAWKADWSQYAIYAATDAEPGWAADNDFFAPALMGFLTQNESPIARNDAFALQVNFTESSIADYALRVSGLALTAGPTPDGYATAPSLLPFTPQSENMQHEISVQVQRDQVGFQREQQPTFYPHAAERSGSYGFLHTKPDECAAMMQFFRDLAAPGDSFWMPCPFLALSLTQAAGAVDTVLHVNSTAAVAEDDELYIFAGPNPVVRKITHLDAVAKTITLAAALGFNATVAGFLAFPLVLARIEKAVLKMTWLQPGAATSTLDWREVPAEQFLPVDETLGVTIGKLPPRVILFQFTRDYRNGTITNWYFSGHEFDVNYNGQTWLHSPFSCTDITQTLNLEDTATISSFASAFAFPGNPLIDDINKNAEAPLTVTIIFADFDGVTVTNPEVMFTGDCAAPSRNGNKITMDCKLGPALTNAKLPIAIRGTICNWLRGANPDGSHLISVACTGPDNIMLKAKWKFTATVANPISSAWPFTLNLTGLTAVGVNAIAAVAANGIFLDWFAPGSIEWGAATNIKYRAITGSSVPIAGALAVTLHRFFKPIPAAGAIVTLYPGCDGQYTTCQAFNNATNPTGKFGNKPNFGADFATPTVNPSMLTLGQLGVSGTKK